MRKSVAVGLLVSMAASLAACGGGEDRLASTDYLAKTLRVGVYREFTYGLTFGGEVSLRHEGYEGDYSILGEPREDWRGISP